MTDYNTIDGKVLYNALSVALQRPQTSSVTPCPEGTKLQAASLEVRRGSSQGSDSARRALLEDQQISMKRLSDRTVLTVMADGRMELFKEREGVVESGYTGAPLVLERVGMDSSGDGQLDDFPETNDLLANLAFLDSQSLFADMIRLAGSYAEDPDRYEMQCR